jgi:hypothetical protein
MISINEKIRSILSAAYDPCSAFKNTCAKMRWEPQSGHVPRGFVGAIGDLSEVQLVLIFAEPGDPQDGEVHTGFKSAFDYAYHCFESRKNYFHKNVRDILELCWPKKPFKYQMRHVWLTESVLCSAEQEGGNVNASIARKCVQRYLVPQLELFPNAVVVALGSKAQYRLKGIVDYFPAFAAAPPGCNKSQARESWMKIPELIKRNRF